MTEKNSRKNETVDALFDAILSLESREECYAFFEDLCTVKEISDMAQRLEAAKLLLGGRTYDQIVKEVEISTATISRINRCIQYGTGGYQPSTFGQLDAPSGFEKIKTTIDPGAAFDLPSKQNLSGSSMNDEDDDDDFQF